MTVSVIIPYYNRPDKLKRCLESIFAQSFKDYEVIVVDDFSDQAPAYEHPEFIYIRNHENIGAGASRNRGLEIARGRYICFLDSDDYWHPDFLETLVGKISLQKELSMVYANGLIINENEEVVKTRRNGVKNVTSIVPHILMYGRPWGTGGCMWDRKTIGNSRWINARTWEDYAFDIDIAIKSNKVASVEKKLIYYDGTGQDRLSNQDEGKSLNGKRQSLIYISHTLFSSQFRNDFKTKSAISIQLLNTIIAYIMFDYYRSNTRKAIVGQFAKWNGRLLGYYVVLLSYSPSYVALRLLRRLRNGFQRGIK